MMVLPAVMVLHTVNVVDGSGMSGTRLPKSYFAATEVV